MFTANPETLKMSNVADTPMRPPLKPWSQLQAFKRANTKSADLAARPHFATILPTG
jgi:hypothetical protein